MCFFRTLELVCPTCHRVTNNGGPGQLDHWREPGYCEQVPNWWYEENYDGWDWETLTSDRYHGGHQEKWDGVVPCVPNPFNTNNIHASAANPDECQFCEHGGAQWHFENADRNFQMYPIRKYWEWPLRMNDIEIVDGGFNLDSDDEYRDSIESPDHGPDVGGHERFFGPEGQFEAQEQHQLQEQVFQPEQDQRAAEEDWHFLQNWRNRQLEWDRIEEEDEELRRGREEVEQAEEQVRFDAEQAFLTRANEEFWDFDMNELT